MSDKYNQTGISGSTFGDNAQIEIKQEIKASRQNQAIPSNVRHGSPNFVGREEELAEIHTKLQAGQGVIVCAVEGMGGVGKTELALQYATRYQQEYVAQYWLSLREMGLAQAVVTIASPYLDLPESMRSASLDQQAAWYWQNWLPETGKLLVILDDVPKAESIPNVAMPIDPRVRVLVTTRERELNVGFESVPLDVLSEEKALELLRKIVGAAKVDKELVTVKEICNTLGYLPLGLELIGEYLSKNRFLTFAKLQERLNLADESIARERKYRFYGDRGVEAAIQLSWDDISAGSQRVAMLLGLFAPVEILWELVAEIGASAEITEAELNEARGQLDSLHLIQPTDEECNFYKIHTLVRDFFRTKLLKAEENHQFRQAFVTSLLAIAKEIPQSPTRDLIAKITPAIPHLDLLSREMLSDILNREEDLVWAFLGIAFYYNGQGLYDLAIPHLENCLKSTESLLGVTHRDVALTMSNLAANYIKTRQYQRSETLLLRCIEIYQNTSREDDPELAPVFNNLASLQKQKGNWNKALYYYQKSLVLIEKKWGNQHIKVATIYNNVGGVYESLCDYEQAEMFFVLSLKIRESFLGADHPDVAQSLCNLAGIYRLQNKRIESENLYIQSIKIRESKLGIDHVDVAITLNNLALLYYDWQRYSEAEFLLKKSLFIRERQVGADHLDVAQSLNNLASLYYFQRNYSEAEPLYLRSLSIRERQLGEDHPDVVTSLDNLASLYELQGRYEEAEPLYVKALEILEVSLGMEHPITQKCRDNLQSLRDLQN